MTNTQARQAGEEIGQKWWDNAGCAIDEMLREVILEEYPEIGEDTHIFAEIQTEAYKTIIKRLHSSI